MLVGVSYRLGLPRTRWGLCPFPHRRGRVPGGQGSISRRRCAGAFHRPSGRGGGGFSDPPRLRDPSPALARGRGAGGASEPVKAARGPGPGIASPAMAPPSLPRALGLGLLALCLLALLRDARARPRSEERLVGGLTDLSPSDPQVQKAAQAAVASYNMGSNSLYYFRDTNILKARSQLVAGIKYYLTVEMGSTACRKNMAAGDHIDVATCPFATGVQEEKLRCDFEILVVPWQNSSQLLKHKCVNIS